MVPTENQELRDWGSTCSFGHEERSCAECYSVLKMKEIGTKGTYRCHVGSSRRRWGISGEGVGELVSASERQ